MTDFTLGSTVTCTAMYLRRTRNVRGYGADKVWEACPCTPRLGVYIGYRTLVNGRREVEDEVGYIFTPTAYIRAALVVFSTRTKPVLVPVDEITKEER